MNSNEETRTLPIQGNAIRIPTSRKLKSTTLKKRNNVSGSPSAVVAGEHVLPPNNLYTNMPELERVGDLSTEVVGSALQPISMQLNVSTDLDDVNNFVPIPPYKLSNKLTILAETPDRQLDAEGHPIFTPDELEETLKLEGTIPYYYLMSLPTEVLQKLNTESRSFLEQKRLTNPLIPNPMFMGGPPGAIFQYIKKDHDTNVRNVVRRLYPKTKKILKSTIIAAQDVSTQSITAVAPQTNVVGCEQMFDPCTGIPIDDRTLFIQKITDTLKQLRKQQRVLDPKLSELGKRTSLYDFIMKYYSNPDISLDLLITHNLGTQGADIFETFCKVFVIFGGIPVIKLADKDGKNFTFVNKIEEQRKYSSLLEAIQAEKVGATRGSGMSDLTFVRVSPDGKSESDKPYCESDCESKSEEEIKTYVGTVKWYKKEKSAEHYDLEKLKIFEGELFDMYKPVSILLFLKNKHEFEMAHRRAYRKHVIKYANQIYDWEDDIKPFLQQKRYDIFHSAQLSGKTPEECVNDILFGDIQKSMLQLQVHQDIIVTGLTQRIHEQPTENIYVIGVLPRGGKTYIAGGLIREYLKLNDKPGIFFWFTSAINETREQVQKDLINKFNDFDDIQFIEARDSSDIAVTITKKHQFWFCSSPLMRKFFSPSPNRKVRDRPAFEIAKENVDLVFFDEAHHGGTSDLTHVALEQIRTRTDIPLIFLSATYLKLIEGFSVHQSNRFIWDYSDVLNTRGLFSETEQESSIQNLRNRFGEELVNSVLQKRIGLGDSYKAMGQDYINFPDLYFISADLTPHALDRFEGQSYYDDRKGFDFHGMFFINSKIGDPKSGDLKFNSREGQIINTKNKVRMDAWTIFSNVTSLRNLIALITPAADKTISFNDELDGGEPLFGTKQSVLDRINTISRETESRFRIEDNPTLLMFLPTGGVGSNIEVCLRAFASLLMKNKWWKERYDVVCITSKDNSQLTGDRIDSEGSEQIHIITNNPKDNIKKLEKQLHCGGKRGLVILAGDKLSMGISLPCTDVVFLFNDSSSADNIIQKMYRALTPSIGKKSSFIVDLNPARSFSAIFKYTRAANKQSTTKSQVLQIMENVYSWDADYFDFNVQKGADVKPQQVYARFVELLNKSQGIGGDFSTEININAVAKKMAEKFSKSILDEKLRQRIVEALTKGSREKPPIFKENARVTFKKGTMAVSLPVARESKVGENLNNTDEYEEVLKIENFGEVAADFVKYMALTSTSEEDFETKLEQIIDPTFGVNAGGNPLQKNILQLVRLRYPIETKLDNQALTHIFIEAIRNYVLDDGREVYRQMKDQLGTAEKKEKVMNIITRHLTPKQRQKKAYGEVFTPIDLVEDMLSHLPSSVWKNHNLKWLDPANGIGNFPITVFYKLDEGLKSWEPNDKKRRKHIVENMLYMIELQSSNSRIARNIFKKLCGDCEPNIWTTDSTKVSKASLLKHGWPESFDIIMGNPPFQKGQNANFYVEFIKLAKQLLANTGYLVYIIPNRILIPQHDANVEILKFNPTFIYHTVNPKFPTKISTTIAGVICDNKEYSGETLCKFSNGELNINLANPTPTQDDDINVKKISDKILEERKIHFEVVSKKPDDKNTIFVQRQWVRYSPLKPSGGNHVFNVMDKPGKSTDGKYIVVDASDKDKIKWYLSRSQAMRFITKIYASSMNVPPFLWKVIPKLTINKKEDNEVYKKLGLNKSDIEVISKNLGESVTINNDSNNSNNSNNSNEEQGGGRRKKFKYTRKNRKN